MTVTGPSKQLDPVLPLTRIRTLVVLSCSYTRGFTIIELLTLLKISIKRALQLTKEHFSKTGLIKTLLGGKEEREYGINIH